MLKIGVFYDGNYFLHVSNYYNYDHPRRRRLSISGLHDFIRHQVAQEEGVDIRLSQIVDAHYFRGRLNAYEARQRGDTLYWDRVFDDILMSSGVTTHYLPLKSNSFGRKEEKGIEVWLALEAFERSIAKEFDVLVLISSDGDYVPLIRKLNTLGTRVMVLSWDFEFTTDTGKRMVTRTSQDLLEEVTYPVAMHQLIDNRISRNDSIINNLFVPTDGKKSYAPSNFEEERSNYNDYEEVDEEDFKLGEIHSLKDGYGFIKFPPNNLFFHHTSVIDGEFSELREGDEVEYTVGVNEERQQIARNVRLIWEEEEEEEIIEE